MTRNEARAAVPRYQVRTVVGSFHVGDLVSDVVERVAELAGDACKRNGLVGIDARRWKAACIEYAKRVHESNRVEYIRVMNPLVGAKSARKIAKGWA